jgi:predicted nucleic acid-binding protein
MVVLDTSALIDCLAGPKRSGGVLFRAISAGESFALPALVLYEWLRGPRTGEELAVQEALLPADSALPFGAAEARIGAAIYRKVARARYRAADLAIAACAIRHGAWLWTLNPRDFSDIPGLRLWRPPR